jgi:hypothetical protein
MPKTKKSKQCKQHEKLFIEQVKKAQDEGLKDLEWLDYHLEGTADAK